MSEIELTDEDKEICDLCLKRFDEFKEGGTCDVCGMCICGDCIGGYGDETKDIVICKDCWKWYEYKPEEEEKEE